jgi:hypothetical protein
MSVDIEGRIRARAYAIWEAEGQPAGDDVAIWLRAEREIMEEPIEAARELARSVASRTRKPSAGARKKAQVA